MSYQLLAKCQAVEEGILSLLRFEGVFGQVEDRDQRFQFDSGTHAKLTCYPRADNRGVRKTT